MVNERDLHILYMAENGRWPNLRKDTPRGLDSKVKREVSDEPYIKWLEEKLISFMRSYTCSECVEVTTCKFAFDHYNTNGDCLAVK